MLKINTLSKGMGESSMKAGLWLLRATFEKADKTCENFNFIEDSIKKVMSIPITELDFFYYLAKWEDVKEMVGSVTKILKEFKWKSDLGDCDNRAEFVSTLFSFGFEMNNCGKLYCEVYNPKTAFKERHYCNLIVCSDGSVYLYDVDNGFRTTKLNGGKIVMGNWEYTPISARFN
jgi:hypothetical protein